MRRRWRTVLWFKVCPLYGRCRDRLPALIWHRDLRKGECSFAFGFAVLGRYVALSVFEPGWKQRRLDAELRRIREIAERDPITGLLAMTASMKRWLA